MANKKSIKAQDIITKYMDIMLMTGQQPASIYSFAKELKIDEQQFYEHFGSFSQLEKEIYALFLKNTISAIELSDSYKNYAPKEKLLSLYFTLVETFTANRSYVLLSLEKERNSLKSVAKLSALKSIFTTYLGTLDFEKIDLKKEQFQKVQEKGLNELFWVQLIVILKFWIDDDSKNFEQTDIFIEKSVHAMFDVMNTQPAKSIMDLGKFIIKEKMSFK